MTARLSGPDLLGGLVEGLRAAGVDVIDLGMVATPMVYFGTNIELDGRRAGSGIMVTGSHNPPDYNGFKMVLGGKAIYGDQIQALHQRIEAGKFTQEQWRIQASRYPTAVPRPYRRRHQAGPPDENRPGRR